LEILITTDAHHSSRPSCNLLQWIVEIVSYPYKIAKSQKLKLSKGTNGIQRGNVGVCLILSLKSFYPNISSLLHYNEEFLKFSCKNPYEVKNINEYIHL
jgi:hypothetical protein